MKALFKTVSHILNHPFNAGRSGRAISSFLRWQIGARILPGAVAVPFVDTTRLLVKPGMTGATGNIYCGLHEFEDMGLVLHAIRPGDLFVDIGANVGSYSVLAAGACGAAVMAIEPIPSTFRHLQDNIRLNGLEGLVEARNIGLGAANGQLRFIDSQDTVNHVATCTETGGVTVPVARLDDVLAGRSPLIVKMDVEGYESEVIKGGIATLSDANLLAILVELNGSGERYGFDEDEIHRSLLSAGLRPYRYQPFTRRLIAASDDRKTSGNTLYVRDVTALQERVSSARRFDVQGRLI